MYINSNYLFLLYISKNLKISVEKPIFCIKLVFIKWPAPRSGGANKCEQAIKTIS